MNEPYHITVETPPIGDVVYYDYPTFRNVFHDLVASNGRWTRWFYRVTAHTNSGRSASLEPLYCWKSNRTEMYEDDLGAIFFRKPAEWISQP